MTSSKKNYLYNLLLTVLNLIFPILSFPYAARILGPVGIGKIQFITSFAQYFALIAALGIPIYGIREIAKVQSNRQELNKVFSELFIIYGFTSITLSLIYLIIVSIIQGFNNDLNFYYVSVGIILLGFCSIDWFYIGIEKFKIIAIRSLVIKGISLVSLYIFVKTPEDVFIYLIINIFALIGNNIINAIVVWSNVKIVTKNLNFKRHCLPLFFIFSTSIATSMYTLLDVVVLGFLSNNASVGYYTAGVKLARITIPFVTSMGAVFMPKISSSLNERKFDIFYNILHKSFDFIIFISVPIAFGLFLLSKEAVILFSGVKFLSAIGVMKILSCLPFIVGLGYFFGIQILIGSGKDKQMFISTCVGMIISVGLNFLLIPFFKEEGAAYANVISEIFVTLSYFYFVRKYFDFIIPFKAIIHAVLSSIVFIPIIWLGRLLFPNLILEVIFSTSVCSIMYSILQFYIFKNHISVVLFNIAIERLRGFIKQSY